MFFFNFFTTPTVLNTCLNYYLFLLSVRSDGPFVKCFALETDLLLSVLLR